MADTSRGVTGEAGAGADARAVANEFHYRLPGTPGGGRPGAHASRGHGPGSAFAGHARLFDRPDPRRLDLRASIGSVPREWRVRVNRQRSSVTVRAIVDVSRSMHAGVVADAASNGFPGGRLGTAGRFVEALGHSAFRSGDAAGMLAFDGTVRDDLHVAPRTGRGIGALMAATLAGCRPERARSGDGSALLDCAARLAGGTALVFIVSDFHWPLEVLPRALERFAGALVVPLVLRDPAELEPPSADGWLNLIDAESGRRRSLWLRESTRRRWREGIARREAAIDAAFGAHDVQPFRITGGFDAEALSRYFLEHVA